MDILILGGSGQLGKTLYSFLKEDFQTVSNRPLFSVLSNDKLLKKLILPNSNYATQVKVKLKEMYKNL